MGTFIMCAACAASTAAIASKGNLPVVCAIGIFLMGCGTVLGFIWVFGNRDR